MKHGKSLCKSLESPPDTPCRKLCPRKDFQNTRAVLLGLGDDKYHFPEVSTVCPGCAVKYKPDDSNDEKWMIIEDAVNPDQDRDEYGPDHIWVNEVIGQSAGGRFHLRRDEIQPRLATITGVVNKYVYRKFEIINGWEDRFSGEDRFFFPKVHDIDQPGWLSGHLTNTEDARSQTRVSDENVR